MKNIVLLEPDQTLAGLYVSALAAKGHSVSHETTAQETLLRVEKDRPSIVLMELDLPAHNGLEFLYEFCSYTDWKDVAVYIHSHLRPALFARMAVEWRHLGVKQYLYKPDTSLKALQQAVA